MFTGWWDASKVKGERRGRGEASQVDPFQGRMNSCLQVPKAPYVLKSLENMFPEVPGGHWSKAHDWGRADHTVGSPAHTPGHPGQEELTAHIWSSEHHASAKTLNPSFSNLNVHTTPLYNLLNAGSHLAVWAPWILCSASSQGLLVLLI